MTELIRCDWCGTDPFYVKYHDEEWGKPVYDDKSKVLTLSYPVAQYRVIIDLLRNDTVYVQFLSYANGHIWADLHTGAVRAK